MVDTIKFSQMANVGDVGPDDKTPGLRGGVNVLFDNGFPLLSPGTTAERPLPSPEMYNRLRFNTSLNAYEYYSEAAADWIQLTDSSNTGVEGITGTTNQIVVDSSDPNFPNLSLAPLLNLPGTLAIQGSVAINDIIDDDTFASATATNIPTAESVKAYVDSQGVAGVSSAEGTEFQVLVNGNFGTQETGDIVLTLPQDIDISSSPRWVNLTLSAGQFFDVNGNKMFELSSVANAVNNLQALPSITGFPAQLNAVGTDGNVGFVFRTKGNGAFEFITQAPTNPFTIYNGTLSQHSTVFSFANTAAARTVTFQDSSGTVAWLSDIPSISGLVESVEGTANEITVDNTDPQNPVLSLPATLIAPGVINVGNMLFNLNSISSVNTNGNIELNPNGTGKVVLYGQAFPNTLGSAGYFLQTDGAGTLSWAAGGGGGSGVVSSGTANQLAWYATTGTTVSGLSTANNGVLVTSASGVPSIGNTLPSAVQNNITALGAQSQALNMNTHAITGVVDPTNAQDAATKSYVDAQSAPFPSGTRMLFQQTAAPTGWTKDTTAAINNGALRTVTGTVGTGGSLDFTVAFNTTRTIAGTIGGTTLTQAQTPAHTHAPSAGSFLIAGAGGSGAGVAGSAYNTTGSTSSIGGGGSHTHTFTGTNFNIGVKYYDCIIAEKD